MLGREVSYRKTYETQKHEHTSKSTRPTKARDEVKQGLWYEPTGLVQGLNVMVPVPCWDHSSIVVYGTSFGCCPTKVVASDVGAGPLRHVIREVGCTRY